MTGTRNNYFVLAMCNINAIHTRTKKNRDFFMPLTVSNEPPVVLTTCLTCHWRAVLCQNLTLVAVSLHLGYIKALYFCAQAVVS